jgi:integrase
MKLTERKVVRLVVEGVRKDRLVFDDAQRGLAVRITASGGRTYLAQYTMHGHKWRVPLGACSAVSLAKAREAAAAVMGDVAKGRNPAADRKAAAVAERAKRLRARLSLRVLIEEWNRLHLAKQRPSYATEAVRALYRAFAGLLDDAAEDLDKASVVRALDALNRSKERTKQGKPKGTAIAARTAAYGRSAFAWALKRGMVTANPFSDLPVPKNVSKRERVLTDDEVGETWRAAAKMAMPYGTIVRLLILTGQRRGEVAGLRWNELADDLESWTLPGERTKNGVTHIVPLSAPARDLLRSLLPEDEIEAKRVLAERQANGELVLPGVVGTFAGWSKSKTVLDKAIADARAVAGKGAPLEPWNVHDVRRSVATGFQRLGVRLEVTEAVLNHISGSRGGIAGVYQRHDWATEKRAALDAWASHVLTVSENMIPTNKIVRLARISV